MPSPHTVLALHLMGFLSGELQGFGGVSSEIQDVPLNMSYTSFDDQYNGCVDQMDAMVGQLQRTEFADKNYADVWKRATDNWNKTKPKGLKPEYAVAVIAYTESKGSLFSKLNEAVRKAGQSEDYYLKNFHFKSFDYLLTRALQVLQSSSNQKCYTTYRGVAGIRFITQRFKKVRFGFFASSSLDKDTALEFGGDTFFTIKTCYGAYIKKFSVFPGEEEVLIPPYESFQVENIVNTSSGKIHINLVSAGTFSKYNCVYVEARRCRAESCESSKGGRVTPWSANLRAPFLLWGFLLFSGGLGSQGFL